jgi:hypothetical protein
MTRVLFATDKRVGVDFDKGWNFLVGPIVTASSHRPRGGTTLLYSVGNVGAASAHVVVTARDW